MKKILWSLGMLSIFLGCILGDGTAQTTILTVPEAPSTTIIYSGSSLHDKPGGFPEGGTGQVERIISPEYLISQHVTYGNQGNFAGGNSTGSSSGVLMSHPELVPATGQAPYPARGSSYYVPERSDGIITETQTTLP